MSELPAKRCVPCRGGVPPVHAPVAQVDRESAF